MLDVRSPASSALGNLIEANAKTIKMRIVEDKFIPIKIKAGYSAMLDKALADKKLE